MKPARILFMARELNLGGSERQMTETARFLDRSRFEPRVGCFLPAGLRGEELRAAGIPVVQFPVRSYKSKSALDGARALAKYIRDEKIQLVHTFDYPLNVFAIPVTRWFTSAVAVSSQRFHREITPRGYLNLLRLTDRIAHAVVVNCEFLRRHMVEEERAPPGKVHVCYNGIDLSFFRAEARERPEALRGASLVIGVVCALRPEKGLPVLLDGFAKAARTQPGLRLAIVGSGPVLPELRAQAARLGVAAQCVFQAATSKIPDWLRAMDIFVLPSLSEAFSNALMEAMACGCCAVASNVGGNPELVRPGQTGLLFDRADSSSLAGALQELIDNPGLRQRFADAGQRMIHENYAAHVAARRMGEIYSQLLAGRS